MPLYSLFSSFNLSGIDRYITNDSLPSWSCGGLTFIYGEGPRSYISHHSFVPEEGDMFIFPATLKHWVFPFKSDCVRISVSGNVSDSIKWKDLKKVKEVKKDEQNNNKKSD